MCVEETEGSVRGRKITIACLHLRYLVVWSQLRNASQRRADPGLSIDWGGHAIGKEGTLLAPQCIDLSTRRKATGVVQSSPQFSSSTRRQGHTSS